MAARRRLGRDNLGHAGLGYTVSHEAILSLGGDGRAAGVFRTEVMCQNVPSLDEPVSPWRGLLRGPPDHQGRRGPSLIMSRKPVRPECV
jgi:hypothetical protein